MTETTSFGAKQVPLDEKQSLVDDVFHSVARRYDLMNDLMSGGIHRLWKDALVSWMAPPRRGRAYRVVDVAGGTGDMAFRIARRSDGHAEVTVADINPSMLAIGKERAERAGVASIEFVEANAETLPFDPAEFDACVIAFGIRNVTRRDAALAEVLRVLRRGGRFLCLEFSAVDLPVLDRAYEIWSQTVIPPLGRVVTGDEDSYQYLVDSIRAFPNQERFAAEMRESGFRRVTWRNLSGGIAAIHSGWKL